MQSIHGQAISHGNSQAPVCTDCHGIHSIKSHHGSEFPGLRAKRGPSHLRALSRRRKALPGIWRARPARDHLFGQLSRAGFARWIAGGCQLRQLPRHAQHLSFERSAFHHQPRQSGADLRPVPPGRHREIYGRQGPRGCAALGRHGQQGGALDPPLLFEHDLRRHRRHAAAQLHPLAGQGDRAAQRAARIRDAHAAALPPAARHAAHQFHCAGADRLCPEIPRLVVRLDAFAGREPRATCCIASRRSS